MPLTGQQIAERVGCSVATVSRILNNAAGVNEESRQAVLELIREHGLPVRRRSKQAARPGSGPAAATQVSGFLEVVVVRTTAFETVAFDETGGIVTADGQGGRRFLEPQNRIGGSFYQSIIDGVIEEARLFSHRVVVQATDGLPGSLVRGQAGEPRPRGVLVVGDRCEGMASFVRSVECPVVTTIGDAGLEGVDTLGIENAEGIAEAFAHLRQLGHSKIGYVAGHGSWPMRERFAAYRLNMLDAGLPIRPDWVIQGTTNIGLIRRAAVELLSKPDRPTAMLACYDGAALAVVQAAAEAGLKVPTDLSVVGFDNEAIAGLMVPALTTMAVPAFEIGQNAVRLLMMRNQRAEFSSSGTCTLRVKPRLMVRSTTAAPAV